MTKLNHIVVRIQNSYQITLQIQSTYFVYILNNQPKINYPDK